MILQSTERQTMDSAPVPMGFLLQEEGKQIRAEQLLLRAKIGVRKSFKKKDYFFAGGKHTPKVSTVTQTLFCKPQ